MTKVLSVMTLATIILAVYASGQAGDAPNKGRIGIELTQTPPRSAKCGNHYLIGWKAKNADTCQVFVCIGKPGKCGEPEPKACTLMDTKKSTNSALAVKVYGGNSHRQYIEIVCSNEQGAKAYECSSGVKTKDGPECKG